MVSWCCRVAGRWWETHSPHPVGRGSLGRHVQVGVARSRPRVSDIEVNIPFLLIISVFFNGNSYLKESQLGQMTFFYVREVKLSTVKSTHHLVGEIRM